MTKKRPVPTNTPAEQRQSRKDILIARKQERDSRNVRIAVGIIIGLIAIVALIALVNELIVAPNQAVLTLGESEVPLNEWQDRVRYERAQRVIFLENQLEAFGGDVGIVQQFGGQVISDLLDPETLGQASIDAMADELAICNALEERGITISDADVDTEIGASFGFFGGLSPTPLPDPTQTVQPTPSLTPIPIAGAEDAQPTEEPLPTATAGPTATPFPTPTPVSEEAFQEQFGGIIGSFQDLGVDEATYRRVVRAQLCRDRLAEALAAEQNLSTIAPHASLFLIAFDSEEDALAAVAEMDSADAFLEQWNTILSQPAPTAEEEEPTSAAFELLWRTQDSLETTVGPDLANAAFALGINQPGGVISVANADGSTTYYVPMVSGREDRELSETELESRRQELVQALVDEAVVGNLVINEAWRSRVPNSPLLDPKFLASPTAAPTPTLGAVETVPATPESGE